MSEQFQPAIGSGTANGSSFQMAILMLQQNQRTAVMAVYSLCRAVDDVADDITLPGATRLQRLAEWRRTLDDIYAGRVPPGFELLAWAVQTYSLKQADFAALIDGMETDAAGESTAFDWDGLDLYCDRVASAVGRHCVRIFGMPERAGIDLAHHLGRALQLTNILRDLDEDQGMGRLYLPVEALRQAGIEAGEAPLDHPQLTHACEQVAWRAIGHYDQAKRIMDSCPRRQVRCPQMMAAVYRSILERLLVQGWAAPRHRVSADRMRLAGAILRYGLI